MNDQQYHKYPRYQNTTYEGSFDHNSPRPPVPGSEPEKVVSDWGPMDRRTTRPTSPPLFKKSRDMGYEVESNCRIASSSSRQQSQTEPNPSESISTPPGCLRWAQSLQKLLEDPDGVKEFRRYLELEGGHHSDSLYFWFACNGLRKLKDPARICQTAKVIYKKFFVKNLLPIPDELRREVGRKVKSCIASELNAEVFEEAQYLIENLINNTTYPNFLKSDLYLQLVQLVQNHNVGSSGELSSDSSSSGSSVSLRDMANLAAGTDPLPIIYEDSEFHLPPASHLGPTPGTGCLSTGYQTPNYSGSVRLTKDMLLVTQKHRADARSKPEAYVDSFMYRGKVPQHLNYNSYNPVSRQDSERQSLSSHSDARTESDNMSMTDSSIDGRSLGRSSRRKAQAMEARHARELAVLNKETDLDQTMIPRTQRPETRQCQPQNPQHFAAILIDKLRCVKKDQESQELLDRKLKESDSTSSLNLADAICAKLQVEDDNDQDILDQHVLRVFSDLTPTLKSPRSHSPTRNRWMGGYMRPRRKDKDGFSTFSSDSGNVHDFPENVGDLKMVKSKSMPEYADDRFVRGSAGRRSSSKKTLTDLTDSGVSVVSDTPPSCHGVPAKDTRVIAWLMESERGSRTACHTHSEMSSKHRGHRASSTTSPNANRHRKGHGSRSSSLERSSAASGLGPAQPFVADPNMPPLPIPNTAVQLEEARRRLMEEDVRMKSRQRSSSKYLPVDVSLSTQSTLRKSTRGSKTSSNTMNPEDVTTVVYSFYDEKVPYRTKIPGRQITLRQFKDFLPKKGNYRYFFKTECEELDNQVIQEEISVDTEVLPTYEGKIMAQIKPLD